MALVSCLLLKNAAMNMEMHISLLISGVFLEEDRYSAAELLGCMVFLLLILFFLRETSEGGVDRGGRRI